MYHPFLHPHAHHPPPLPLHAQFHSLPFTHQLFQPQHQPPHAHHHPHHHQFQLFHPHHQPPQHEPSRARFVSHPHLGLDPEHGPDNSAAAAADSAMPPFLAAAMNFKLAADNTSSGAGGGREGIDAATDDAILHADADADASESRLRPPWQPLEDESAIKEPTWRPLDIDYIHSSSRRAKEEPEQPAAAAAAAKYSKKTKEGAADAAGASNYKLFNELEAIYNPGNSTSCGGAHQTGSGSALTGDENPLVPAPAVAAPMDLGPIADTHKLVSASETSTGEEAPVQSPAKGGGGGGSGVSGRRIRKRRQRQLSSLAAFFERLVKQLMDHQEGLHRRFLEAVERREQERAGREEAWRLQEAAKSAREATAHAHERELAAAREAAIVAFLEKLTGESIQLPAQPDHAPEQSRDQFETPLPTTTDAAFVGAYGDNVDQCLAAAAATRRWPKAEVQALIGVRSEMEARFQEPGLKGPLWEEVSGRMAAMGYRRSAKRCKEKWENINKYFRKAKESGKQRPSHSKTCPYFHQLDLLHSRSSSSPAASLAAHPPLLLTQPTGSKAGTELLDAMVVPTDNLGFEGNKEGGGNNAKVANEDDHEEGTEDREDGRGGGGRRRGDQPGARRKRQTKSPHSSFMASNNPRMEESKCK